VTAARIALGGLAIVGVALVLAACASQDPKAAPTMAEAKFSAARFDATGAAILAAYDGGVRLRVNFNGEAPGEYRVT
jgi:hypothetical protein